MKTIQHIFCRSVLLLITTTTCVWSDPTPPIDTLTCFDKPPARGTILAQVGTETITVEETAETLRQMGRAAIRQHQDPQHMRRFIEDQVRFELLVKAAAERGLERDPDVIDAARKVMVRKLLQRDKDAMASDQMVNDAMIRNAYERDLHEYVQPEKRRLADIQLAPTSEGRAQAQMLIDTLQASPNDKSLFARLAAKHSLNKETRYDGGASMFSAREEIAAIYGLTYTEAAFALPLEAIAPQPVQSQRGWHVLRVLAIRPPLTRDFESVKDEIRERLMVTRRGHGFGEYLQALKERYPVAIYDQRIDDVIHAINTQTEPQLKPDPKPQLDLDDRTSLP